MLECFVFMLSFMLYFHVFTHVCFHLISTFEEWHNVSYRYVSYVKTETSDIWRTGSWFLKPVGERVEENYVHDLVKSSSSVKTRTLYKACNVCYQVFLEKGKIDYNSKI